MALLAFILGALLAAACTVAVLATRHASWRRAESLLWGAALGRASPQLLRQLLGDRVAGLVLPDYATWPDVQSCDWINTVVAQLWPHIDIAACRLAMKDKFLEKMLNSTSFWRPAVLKNSTIKVLGVMLGQSPPVLTGVKAYPAPSPHDGAPAASEAVTMDFNFRWASRLDVRLSMQLLSSSAGWLSSASTVKVGVRDLVASGKLRVVLRPLIDTIPVVQAATPRGLVSLPPKPEGLLTIEVIEAVNVPRMDLFGASDPYVKLCLSQRQKFRTSTKARTLSPVWNETFEAIVYSSDHQRLELVLYDNDVGRSDDLIGRVELPLKELDLSGVEQELWVQVPRSTEKKAYGTHSSKAESHDRDKLVITRVSPPPDLAELSGSALHVQDSAQAEGGGTGLLRAALGRLSPSPPPPGQAGQGAAPLRGQVQRLSNRAEQLRQLLPLGSSKPCQLHLRLTYARFSQLEADAAAGAQLGKDSLLRRLTRHSRMRRALHSGVLQLRLDKAEDLVSKAAHGWTSNMVVQVTVGDQVKTTERAAGLATFQHKRNPVFDITLDFAVDGDTAQRQDVAVKVELWVHHLVRKPRFKGRMTIPLQDVRRARQLRGTWPLEGVTSGKLSMSLEWMSAMGT